ncbi:MAG: DUF4363 family protein [Clostridiales bacterium]|nr:DUF4363 family protein [Clostridiales bacterium]
MKRVIICSIILATIITQSIISLAILRHKNNEFSDLIDQAVTLNQSGQQDKALEKTKEVYDYWQDYYKKISFLIQSSKLDNISYSVAKLKPLLEMDSEDFFAECSMIKVGIIVIYDSEYPHFYSVF